MKMVLAEGAFFVVVLIFLVSTLVVVNGKKTTTGKNSLGKTRILSELRDIQSLGLSTSVPFNKTTDECGVRLGALKSNLLEIHFSFTGVEGSPYCGGIYHGRIRLPPEYPRKAPMISVLTPTGRWEVGKDICLSATSYHQETWDPTWNLRTLVMGLRGHILTQPREIGAISTTPERRQALAAMSKGWICPICGVNHADLVPLEDREGYNVEGEPHQLLRVVNAPGILVIGDSGSSAKSNSKQKNSGTKVVSGKQQQVGKQQRELKLEDMDVEEMFQTELVALRKKLRRLHILNMKKRQQQLQRLRVVVFALSFLLTIWMHFFMAPQSSRTRYSMF